MWYKKKIVIHAIEIIKKIKRIQEIERVQGIIEGKDILKINLKMIKAIIRSRKVL